MSEQDIEADLSGVTLLDPPEQETSKGSNSKPARRRRDSWIMVALVVVVCYLLLYFLITFYNKREMMLVRQLETCVRIAEIEEQMNRDTFLTSPQLQEFSPKYNRELSLFKSLNHDEQQAYLNMPREAKFAHYGQLLN